MKNDAPIIHDVQAAIRAHNQMRTSGTLRNAFRKPEELSIFTAHNYSETSLLEKNLDFLGIEGYHVVNERVPIWSNSQRVRWFVDYLENECSTPLVLYCDADDVVLRDDPRRVLDVFASSDCDLLFCSTRWPLGYRCIPEIRRWAEQLHPRRYLNGGVCVGHREYMCIVYKRVLEYVTEQDTSGNHDSHAFYRQENAYTESFPRGVGCDQTILRFLEPEFYPRLKIDAESRLAWRNDNRTLPQKLIRSLKRRMPQPIKQTIKRHLLSVEQHGTNGAHTDG